MKNNGYVFIFVYSAIILIFVIVFSNSQTK